MGQTATAPPAPAAARTAADLRTEATLPAHLVHKHKIDQVFVTDWMAGPGDDFATVAVQLPLAHARFSDTAAPYHDIVLVAEAVRQAALIMATQVLGVPGERQFLIRELKLMLDPLERNRKARDTCDMIVSQDPSSTFKMRPGGSASGARAVTRCAIAGHPSARCEVVGAFVPESLYASFRGNKDAVAANGLPDPTPRGEVEPMTGRTRLCNSVITPVAPTGARGGYEARLIVETDDATFFDHPLDHIPGLLLIEGVKQAAIAAACKERGLAPENVVVSAFDMRFSRICEFQPDVICAVELDDDASGAQVRCSQSDKAACSGTVTLTVV